MIGIDAGTFHTVAVEFDDKGAIHLPRRSIPSIARRIGDKTLVGWEAKLQQGIKSELILAPKLRLANATKDRALLQEIIQQLVKQALEDLVGSGASKAAVVTVPPGWNFDQCEILKEAIQARIPSIQFIHEPVALTLAALHMAPQYQTDPRLIAKLDSSEHFLVCDWGAGTVDLALIGISRHGLQYEFSCLFEHTDTEHGGTAIARDVVQAFREENKGGTSIGQDEEAYLLQAYWEGEHLGRDFSGYAPFIESRLKAAATSIAKIISGVLQKLGSEEADNVLVVLHGGPLESSELRKLLKNSVNNLRDLDDNRFVHIGSDFAKQVPNKGIPWRRDVLVAFGASLFGQNGKALPEFEYEVLLKNARGESTSSVKLAIGPNLSGRQIIQPPFTDTDYYVEVRQLRKNSQGTLTPTAVSKELAHYVRPGALLRYSVSEAGVGYACIEALEVTNTMSPKPFSDSKSAKIILPERSTRFLINMR